jgi:hypothetical protein
VGPSLDLLVANGMKNISSGFGDIKIHDVLHKDKFVPALN